MKKKRFYIADEDEIKQGKTTDIYFLRTKEILEKEKITKFAVAEFTTQKFPNDYPWAIFAGLEEVLKLIEGLPVNLYSLPEGTLFTAKDYEGYTVPVMVIEGDYKEYAIYETPILGFICQATGIATKSARIKKLAKDKMVLSFGIRRMHPAIAPMIDRYAFIGGCDGVSCVLSAEMLGEKPKGTMPHALIIIMGEKEAFASFDKHMPEEIPRIALIDTYGDEKIKSIEASEFLKNKLFGVRLDTPSSRRGKMVEIVKEVRWELDIRGYKNVKIVVSGGLDEEEVKELSASKVDIFGVGTSISNAKVIDFSMDIVEVEGLPVAKKGKLGGRKEVWRCPNCLTYKVTPSVEKVREVICPKCGNKMEKILFKYIESGRIVKEVPDAKHVREYVLKQIEKVEI